MRSMHPRYRQPRKKLSCDTRVSMSLVKNARTSPKSRTGLAKVKARTIGTLFLRRQVQLLIRLIRLNSVMHSYGTELLSQTTCLVGDFGARVQRGFSLDEHDETLLLGNRIVTNALRNNERVALT